MTKSFDFPSKALLIISLLHHEGFLTVSGKSILKELVIERDPRLKQLVTLFEERQQDKSIFLQHVRQVIHSELFTAFSNLYHKCPLEVAKAVSKAERKDRELLDKSLTYGEIETQAFVQILAKVPRQTGTFYDLGSGSGRAVLLARLFCDFDKCIGIECLDGLYKLSCELRSKYLNQLQPILDPENTHQVSFYHSNLQDFDWSDADVCFANSTCFQDSLVDEMSELAEQMAIGSYFITFTKPLNSRRFVLVEKTKFKMSWGPATVFIQRRSDEKYDKAVIPLSALPPTVRGAIAESQWSTCSNCSSESGRNC